MICHALNNGLMVVAAREKWLTDMLKARNTSFVPWEWVLAGLALMAAGLWLVTRASDRGDSAGRVAFQPVVHE
jgi:hypothetical protein